MRTCDADGCTRKHVGQGMCRPHYMRWWRTGRARMDVPVGPRRGGVQAADRPAVDLIDTDEV